MWCQTNSRVCAAFGNLSRAVTGAIVDIGRRIRVGVQRNLVVTVGVLSSGAVDVIVLKVGVLRVLMAGQSGLLRGHALLG